MTSDSTASCLPPSENETAEYVPSAQLIPESVSSLSAAVYADGGSDAMTEAEADELNVVLNLSGLFKRAGIAPHADFCCPGSYRRSAFAAQVAGPPHIVQVIERGLRRFGADPHAQGRRTATNPSTYLGLDVHKETIAVAIADGRSSDVRFYGGIKNTPVAIAGMLKRLGGRYGKLRVVYEAGPCGYGIYRQVNAAGHVCEVVSPAHTPRRAGDRVKTDRRDAILLARLVLNRCHRSPHVGQSQCVGC
jgi:hypothetical protein